VVALERCLAGVRGLTISRAFAVALSMCTKEAGLTMQTCTEPAPSTMCFSCTHLLDFEPMQEAQKAVSVTHEFIPKVL